MRKKLFFVLATSLILTSEVFSQTVIKSFVAPGDNATWGLTWDGQSLWSANISDSGSTIYQIDTSGNVLSSFDIPTIASGLAWDGSALWISEGLGDKIYRVSKSGVLLKKIATKSKRLAGLAWDGANLWVIFQDSLTINKLDSNGNVLIRFSIADYDGNPSGLTWNGSSLWLCESFDNQIIQLSSEGNFISSFTGPGTNATELEWDEKYLWVSDIVTDRIYQLAVPILPVAIDLGVAERFTVLSLGGTVTAETDETFTGHSGVFGDVGVANGGDFNISGNSFITGTVFLNTAGRLSQSGSSTIGAVLQNAETDSLLNQAIGDALTASGIASSLPSTIQNINYIDNYTGTIVGREGINVLNISNLILSDKATLNLSAPGNSYFVINITGGYQLSGGSNILLLGGLTHLNLLFNIIGAGSKIDLSGSSNAFGILLAPARGVGLSGSSVLKGKIIAGGGQITLSGGAQAIGDFSTDVKPEATTRNPKSFTLWGNFPNPFNALTQIKYYLSKDGLVELTVYNLLGKKVKVLVNQRQTRGEKIIYWDGKDDLSQDVASGIYFYKLVTQNGSDFGKMTLLK